MLRLVLSLILCLPLSLSAQWSITATDIDPANYYGITVANGMVGLVSSPEPMRVSDVVLNGVYDDYQRGGVSNILKTFNHMNMALNVGGWRIGAGDMTDFTQTLDIQQAELVTTFRIGDSLRVRHTLVSLRHLPFTALARVEITAERATDITAYSIIEAPEHLRDVRQNYTEVDQPHVLLGVLSSVAESPTGKHRVAAATSFVLPEHKEEEPNIIHENWDFNRHLAKFHRSLAAGETYTFGVVGSSIASQHSADPNSEAQRLTIFAKLEGMDRLLERHRAAWAELWKSDIQIEGNARDQLAVRSALYHLYSFARAGQAYSLSPMGLSGLGYNGHVFWDTEIWMYPPILPLQPGMAKSLMQYRYDRLPAARMNAFMHGYEGAMFPWESADDGSEDTPVWALTGPFQHHITGDVAWAMWKYFQTTQDTAWLRSTGYPVIREAADFFVSRVDREGPGNYSINNVIGANEWEENIDNNAYTNGMAITALRYAGDAAQVLALEPDPEWAEVAANIPILQFPDGTTRENATYDGVTIKQADVNLLSWPMDIVREEAQIRKDLAYYEPRLSPDGPAMGKAILSLLYARLGDVDRAYELFEQSYQPNEVPPFGVLAETAGGTNPYFATGAGGMLQAVLFGFGGLDFSDAGITVGEGRLPDAWTSLTITGVGKEGRRVRVE
jgi:trehalose/maltose hydrolase-like predicted phosphorylase